MWKVDIYLETDSTFQGKRERKCGYVLSTMVGNEEKTKENFGISNGTYHQSVLMALIEALSRMNVSSEICVHTQDSYVASRLLKLEEMAGEGWRDSKGELIKNAAEWEQVYRLIHAFPEAHKMTARFEKHSYSTWLQEMMKKNECGRIMGQVLKSKVDQEILDIVQDALTIELNRYEVQERTTELSVVDNSAVGMLRRYIATKKIEGKAESTLKRYWEQNLQLIQFLGKDLNKITTDDLRLFMACRRQQNKVSNRTLDGMRRCYRSFFTWLTTEGLIEKNPCIALNQIKCRKQIKKPYTAVELELLRKSCENIRDLALVEFLYSSGCRVSEISKLDISDINMETGECCVIGKGNKERIVYLTDIALLYLKRYLEKRKDSSVALFAGKGTPRLTKGGIETLLKRIGNVAGVENVHPHRFRRTLATNLLDRGMSIQDVAVILGHADLKTTQIYCFINQSNVKNAYRKYAA